LLVSSAAVSRTPVAEVQEIAHGRDGFGAIAAGEQAVVADAVEALGGT
jgi:hypothetical protein